MTEKRFTYFKSKIGFGKQGIDDKLKGYTFDFTMDNVLDCMNDLSEENEQLKSEIKGMEELLKSYRKTIKHDAELLADATKKGYLPPLKEWKEV